MSIASIRLSNSMIQGGLSQGEGPCSGEHVQIKQIGISCGLGHSFASRTESEPAQIGAKGISETMLQGDLFNQKHVKTFRAPAAVVRHIPVLSRDLSDYFPGLNAAPDFIEDALLRKDITVRVKRGETVLVQTSHNTAWEAARIDLVSLGEKAWKDKWEGSVPSKDDILKMGLRQVTLGQLGAHVSLALFKIAWQQRGTARYPGQVILPSWNQLCRLVYPRFGNLPKTSQDACRRRIQKVVINMTRLRIFFTYNRRGNPHTISTLWISRYETVTGSNTIILLLGLFDDDYVLTIGEQALQMLGDRRLSSNDKVLLMRLWGESSGSKNMTVRKLVEWGGWKSKDGGQNERALARALYLFCEVGYLTSATLIPTPNGLRYKLEKHPGHHFPPRIQKDKKAYPCREQHRYSTKQEI